MLTRRFRRSLSWLSSEIFDRGRALNGGLAKPVPARRRAIDCCQLEDRTLFSAAPVGAEALVNTTTAGVQQTHAEGPQSVAMDASGNYVVVWTSAGQDGDGQGVFAQRFNASGVAQGSEFQVNTTTARDQYDASVAMDDAGSFVITWTGDFGTNLGVRAQRYNASGVAQGGEVQVNTTTTGDQSESSVGMDDTGDYVVVWSSTSQDGDGKGIFGQRYNSSGVAQGGEFQVNTYTTGDQDQPTVAMGDGGEFVVVWESAGQDGDGKGVYAQRYNASGVAQGSEFRVNQVTLNDQYSAAVAVADSGDFIITWSSYQQDGSNWGIYARRYNAAGSALGAEFLVNTTTGSAQENSSVAVDSSGNFLISWRSNGGGTGGYDVILQLYDSSGAAQGGEIQVNTTTPGAQEYASVAMAPSDDAVVVWSGNGPGDTDGIFAQRFSTVNDAPVNSVPGAQSTNEDTARVFSSGNGNQISISDADAGSSPVQVTLTGTNGTVTLAGITGLSFSSGDGTADATMTFTGTVANINTALNGAFFSPTANFTGAASLQVATNDQGNNGVGGALSDTDTINITVNAVNDAPVNTVPAAQSTNEDTALVFSSGGGNQISIADVDAGGSQVRVTLTGTNGTVTLNGTSGLTFTAGDGTADATMTFTGTTANINTALNGLSFSPTANFNGAASLAITTNDQGNTGAGGALSDSDTVNITVNAVNDNPVNTVPAPQSVSEDASLVFSSGNGNQISVGDVDAGGNPLQVTLTGTNGTVTLVGTTGLTFIAGDGTADATMTFTGTAASINTALNGLSFAPTADFNGAASLQIDSDDQGSSGSGGAKTDTDTVSITVNAVNDAPANTVPGDQSTNKDVPLVFSAANGNAISIADIDAGASSVRVTLAGTNGTITLGGTTGLSFTAGDGNADATMTFSGTIANINAALNGTSFAPTNNYVGTASLQVTTNDLGNTGSGGAQSTTDTVAIEVVVETRVNTTTVHDQYEPVVAIDSAGNYVIVWTSDQQDGGGAGIIAQRYNAAGVPQGGEFRVNTFTAGAQNKAGVVMDANGNFVVVWVSDGQDGDKHGVYAQRYNAAGVAQGGEFRVNTTTADEQDRPTVAMDSSGNFVIAWESTNQDGDKRGVYAQRYNASGVAQGGEFRVNTTTADEQDRPMAAMDSNGNFVIAWESTNQDGGASGIYAQRYDAAGAAQGVEFRVNTTTAGSQDKPAVAMNASGGFVIAWASNLQDGDAKGIYAQRYDAAGVAQGGEFLVNTTTVDDQDEPAVGIDSTGAFAIAWESNLQDGKLHGIYSQQYSAAGAVVGSEFRVSSTTAGEQRFPALAMDGFGDFVVAWEGNGVGDGYGVFHQRYPSTNDAPVNTVPGAQSINEDTSLVFSSANGNQISVADVDVGTGQERVTLAVTSGTLTLNGTAGLIFVSGDGTADASMIFTGTIASINSALNGLIFAPPADANGAVTLTITTNDQGNTGVGGAKSDTDTVVIAVNAVNDAPVNTVPAAQSVNEDTPLVFSSGNGNQVSIADVDAGTLQVTLTGANGTLSLNGTAGLSFTAGDGTADAVMTFTGSAANINAALNGMSFTGTANYNGAASLQIATNDQGNTGTGGPLSDTDTVNITVNAVNDPPVIAVPAAQSLNEDTVLVFSSANGNQISVSDVDAGSNPVQVTLSLTSGTMTLNGTAGLAFTSGDGTSDASMQFSGTLANINAALNGMAFSAPSDFNGAVSLTVATSDLGNTGAGGAQSDNDGVGITVNAVNDAPVNTVPAPQTTIEDTPLVFSAANGNQIAVSDVDAAGAPLQITLVGSNGGITLSTTTGLSFVTGDGTADAVMTFTGSLANINTALDGLSFGPAADYNGAASLTISTNDQGNTGAGGALSDSDVVNITVNAVNDTPINTVPPAQLTNENAPLVFSAANGNQISISDTDAGTLQVTLTATNGTLTLAGTTGLTFTSGDGGADAVMTFSGSAANINAALNGLSFAPPPAYNGPASLQIDTNDLGNTGPGGPLSDSDTVGITVSAVNDPPVNTIPGPQTTNEDTPVVFSSAGGNQISIGDIDAGGSSVQVTLSSPDGTVTLSGTNGLTFTSGDGTADGIMTFTGTLADINSALDGLVFTPAADFNGATGLQLVTNDLGNTGSGGPQTDTDTVNITVSAVNDAPSNSVPGPQNTIEDTPLTFSAGGGNQISIADVDAGMVQVTLTATNGTLTLNGVTGLAFSSGSGSSDAVMVFTGSQNDINAALDGLVFSPAANFNGPAALQIATDDLGNSGAGGALNDVQTVSIAVSSVNDAPVISVPLAQNTNEDTPLTFSAAGGNAISVGDVDTGINPVQVTLTASDGTISLSGTSGLSFSAGDGAGDASMTFTGTLSDINAALDGLLFTAPADWNGLATLQISVDDQGNSGPPGALIASASVDIAVNAINDAPVNIIPGAQATSEDTPLVFSTAAGNALSIGDVDAVGNPVQVTLTATNGTLTLSAVTGLAFTTGSGAGDSVMAFSGTVANINAALEGLVYAPTADFNGPATLQIDTNDLGNSGAGGPLSVSSTVAIAVNPVNDAPVNTVPGNQVIDEDTPLVFSAANGNPLSVADADAGANPIEVTLTSTNGTLSLSGVSGLTFLAGSGVTDATMTFRGTLADINAALDGLVFTPAANFHGAANVAIATNDLGNGGGAPLADSRSVNITVNSINDVPQSTGDAAYQTTQNVVLTVPAAGVLVNDMDVDGDVLTAVLVAGPANGSITLNPDGSFVYTPDASFRGTDQFSYQATDGTALGSVKTVNIAVNVVPPLPPSASDSPPQQDSNNESRPQSPRGAFVPAPAAAQQEAPSAPPRHKNQESAAEKSQLVANVAAHQDPEVADTLSRIVRHSRVPQAKEYRVPTAPASDQLQFAIDTLWQNLESWTHDEDTGVAMDDVAAAMAAGVTVTLSVGYALWQIQGGSLLASMFMARPLWERFDPLPVLEFWENKKDQDDPLQPRNSSPLQEALA